MWWLQKSARNHGQIVVGRVVGILIQRALSCPLPCRGIPNSPPRWLSPGVAFEFSHLPSPSRVMTDKKQSNHKKSHAPQEKQTPALAAPTTESSTVTVARAPKGGGSMITVESLRELLAERDRVIQEQLLTIHHLNCLLATFTKTKT